MDFIVCIVQGVNDFCFFLLSVMGCSGSWSSGSKPGLVFLFSRSSECSFHLLDIDSLTFSGSSIFRLKRVQAAVAAAVTPLLFVNGKQTNKQRED